MTLMFTLAEAETKLAELVDLVRRGEEIVIEHDGAPVALLSHPPEKRPDRIPGTLAHLGDLIDKDLFLRPDLELEEAAHGDLDLQL